MKRIIILAAMAALSLVSCQRDEIPAVDSAEDVIGFAPYMEKSRTKVHVHDLVSYSGAYIPWGLHSFKVAAYLHDTNDSYFGSQQTATAVAGILPSGAYYATGTTYYWPTTSSLDFYAYASAFDTTMSVTAAGVCTLGYRGSTNPADSLYGRDDLVVACEKNAKNKGDHSYTAGTSAQSLTFTHAMAKVNRVSFKAYHDINKPYDNANYRFTVVEVALDSVQSKGKYNFSRSDQRWTGGGGYFRHTFSNVLDENANSNYFLGSDTTKSLRVYGYTRTDGSDLVGHWEWFDDKFILIPQSAILRVTYKVEYKTTKGTWVEVMDTTTKSAMLHFEEGEAYNIKVTLTNKGEIMVFSAEVDKWDDPDSPLEVRDYIEDGYNYGPGIALAGSVWAPVNCGTGAGWANPTGLLYQWGRKYGQRRGTYNQTYPDTSRVSSLTIANGNSAAYAGYYSEACNDGSNNHNWWSDSGVDSTLWNANGADPDAAPVKTAYDPCPEGWRVPTEREMQALVDFALGTGNYFFNYSKKASAFANPRYGASCQNYPNNYSGLSVYYTGRYNLWPLVYLYVGGKIGIAFRNEETYVSHTNIEYKTFRYEPGSVESGNWSDGAGYFWTSTAHCWKRTNDGSGNYQNMACFTGKCLFIDQDPAAHSNPPSSTTSASAHKNITMNMCDVEPVVAQSVRCVVDGNVPTVY